MICAPAEARPAFRLGVRERNGRERSEDGADDHISEKGRAKSLSFWREEPQRGSPEGESSMSLRDGWSTWPQRTMGVILGVPQERFQTSTGRTIDSDVGFVGY